MFKRPVIAGLLSLCCVGALAQGTSVDLATLSAKRANPDRLRIFQQVSPPQTDLAAQRFVYGPVTDAATGQVARNVATTWRGRTHAWVWGMRARAGRRLQANPVLPRIDVGGREAGMEFTSYARADAATLAIIAYHCGHTAHQPDRRGYLDFLNAAQLPDSAWIDHARAAADAQALFRQPAETGERLVIVDRVVGPDARQWDVPRARRTGILIDWEVADGRTGEQATRALRAAARMIADAGLESTLYLNPLNGGNVRNEGLGAHNLAGLHAMFRWLTVTVWPGDAAGDAGRSLREQLKLLQGPAGRLPIDYARLQLTVGIGPASASLTDSDAKIARLAVQGSLRGLPGAPPGRQRFGALNIWRANGAPRAGSTYDRIVATLIGANDN